MKKRTFRTRLKDGSVRIVAGWALCDGMVLHRALLADGCSDREWSVSDPLTGGRIVSWYGMSQTLVQYRTLVAHYGSRWGEALAVQRQRFNQSGKALS